MGLGLLLIAGTDRGGAAGGGRSDRVGSAVCCFKSARVAEHF